MKALRYGRVVLLNFLLLYTFLNLSVDVSSFNVKMKSLNCEVYKKSSLELTYCRIEAESRYTNTLSIYLKPKEPMIKAKAHVKLYKRANGWKPFLYEVNVDGCKFLANPKSNPIGSWFWDLMKPYSNINHTCPYNHDIWLTKFRLTEESLKLPFPLGMYLVDTSWAINGEPWFRMNFSLEGF